jgi:hypothetical protein
MTHYAIEPIATTTPSSTVTPTPTSISTPIEPGMPPYRVCDRNADVAPGPDHVAHSDTHPQAHGNPAPMAHAHRHLHGRIAGNLCPNSRRQSIHPPSV